MKHPIPSEALDDRLGFVGNSGSGKSYNSMGSAERIIRLGHRVCIIDLTGVWHGLRLKEDGKTPSGLDVVIFGGKHGDLPLTEHSGALIGETVAGMRESCIIDLKMLGTKAAVRRFMLAFTTALYRRKVDKEADLLTFIVDEADMYAPQVIGDKEGGTTQLLGMMETIVRRGRIDGFIPWLITQRPAALNKNVLSQVDGMVIFKLTSPQDRDAVGNWVKGQADMTAWKGLYGQLPVMATGQGIVWLPGRQIFETVQFPKKKTFDSTRSPKRGEKRATVELKPLDLGKLKERLAKVDAEAKANDPATLKAEVRRLTAELAKKPTVTVTAAPAKSPKGPTQKEIDDAIAQAEAAAMALGQHRGRVEYAKELLMKMKELEALGLKEVVRALDRLAAAIEAETRRKEPKVKGRSGRVIVVPLSEDQVRSAPASSPRPAASPRQEGPVNVDLSRPQQKILDALAWLESVGIEKSDRTRAAMLANVSSKSSGFEKNVSTLSTKGLLWYPGSGELQLTDDGRKIANAPSAPPTNEDLQAAIRSKISGPQWALLEQLIAIYPNGTSREDLANAANVSALSSGFEKNVSTLSGFGFVRYPEKGHVAATELLFVEK